MKIAISGSSGLIGMALRDYCASAGIDVLRLVRDKPKDRRDELFWDYEHELLDWTGLNGCDAVVHLAGAPLTAGRWTEKQRRKIFDSRVKATQFLCQCLEEMPHPPATLLTASAIGYYGDRDDEVLTEESGLGEGFLTDVCEAWEAATGPARKKGIRVVPMRFGLVVSSRGGALPMMVRPFKLGIGGRLGNGRQYMSWIALPDLICAMQHILDHPELSGPVNLVSPSPLSNEAFTRILGDVLHRPTVLPVPASLLKLVLGDMAREMLLASLRVQPARLVESGFSFEYTDLHKTLDIAIHANGF